MPEELANPLTASKGLGHILGHVALLALSSQTAAPISAAAAPGVGYRQTKTVLFRGSGSPYKLIG